MKRILVVILALGSLFSFANSNEIHELVCKEIVAGYSSAFFDVESCVLETELEGSVEAGDTELSLNFYDCDSESDVTYFYDVKEKSISSGDSWIGVACD